MIGGTWNEAGFERCMNLIFSCVCKLAVYGLAIDAGIFSAYELVSGMRHVDALASGHDYGATSTNVITSTDSSRCQGDMCHALWETLTVKV